MVCVFYYLLRRLFNPLSSSPSRSPSILHAVLWWLTTFFGDSSSHGQPAATTTIFVLTIDGLNIYYTGCSNAVTPVARLAAAWNLPHISYGGTSTTLGNKTEFTTLTRLSFTMSLFAKFYMEVFNVS